MAKAERALVQISILWTSVRGKTKTALFPPSNLIFGDNEFDRDIKREILHSE